MKPGVVKSNRSSVLSLVSVVVQLTVPLIKLEPAGKVVVVGEGLLVVVVVGVGGTLVQTALREKSLPLTLPPDKEIGWAVPTEEPEKYWDND